MTIDEYQYFVAAYRHRSFSEAARKMNITSQGLGKAVKSLEAQLGVRLFSRSPLGIEPTEIASALYPSFCKVIEEEDRIKRLVAAERRRLDAQVFLGRDSKLGDAIGIGVAEYCRKYEANIKMMLSRDSEDIQAQQLIEQNYDFRFLSVELDTLPSLPRQPICKLSYVPVVNSNNKLVAKQTISLLDLRGRTVLTDSLSHTPMRLLEKMCLEHGFELKLRALAKTYIWDLLSTSPDDVTFIRTNEADEYPWTSSVYTMLKMTPPLDTQIVVQTTHDEIDENLLFCIRESLKARKFD